MELWQGAAPNTRAATASGGPGGPNGSHRSEPWALTGCRSVREWAGSAGVVVPALVVPAVDLACAVAGTLVFWRAAGR